MNDDFSQRLLDRIEHDHITPIPRWLIRVRQGASWLLLGLCLLCAAFLGSLILLATFHIDLEFLRASSFGPMLRLLLASVPFVWVALLLLFCLLEIFLLRRQAHAYRYPTGLIVGMVVLGICFGGLGLYATRLPERIQTSFPRHLPPRVRPWFERERPTPRPEDGVLFGRIREIKADHLLVNDPPGHLWRVIVNPEQLKQGDFIRPGQTVIIQGRIQAREVFEAHSIRPYQGRPGVPSPRMK